MPRIVASVAGQYILLENEQDGGALLGVLSRARKLEYNYGRKGEEPLFILTGAETISGEEQIEAEVQILEWSKVGRKPEPKAAPEPTVEAAQTKVPAEEPF